MSKLGKVYEINIKFKDKRIYPVVYMNKSYLYCKQYGCDELHVYVNPEYTASAYRRPMNYDEFKRMYEAGEIKDTQTYLVYVPAHIKTFFEWIKEKTPLELEIEKVKKGIDILDKRIKDLLDSIEHQERCIRDSIKDMETQQSYLKTLNDQLQMQKDMQEV